MNDSALLGCVYLQCILKNSLRWGGGSLDLTLQLAWDWLTELKWGDLFQEALLPPELLQGWVERLSDPLPR